jgi:hypothetical protein
MAQLRSVGWRRQSASIVLLLANMVCDSGWAQSITVDGDPSDWVGIAAVITDPPGNALPGDEDLGVLREEDLVALRITNDASFVYFLGETANVLSPDVTQSLFGSIFLDTDRNPSTGCFTGQPTPDTPVVGAEYFLAFVMRFGSISSNALEDMRDCTGTSEDFPGAVAAAIGERSFEVAIPISTLRLLTPTMTGFAADFYTNQTRYRFQYDLLEPLIDATPPMISGMPAVNCTLRPPNHKLVQVAAVTAIDAQSGIAPGSFTLSGRSNEASDPGDIVITRNASGGFIVQLRAERLGTGTGRIYTLTATAADLAGNRAMATATCVVPHDRGK